MSKVILIVSTCPDEDTAQSLARGLVEENLVACVNIVPLVRSIYRWQGETQDDAESMMLIKTARQHYDEVELWLREHHPYEVPEIISMDVDQGADAYLNWVTGSVANNRQVK